MFWANEESKEPSVPRAGIDAIKAAGQRALGVENRLTSADSFIASTSEISGDRLHELFAAGS